MSIYPNLQKIRARMQLLNVTPHSIIEDGSYNIYTLRGESSLGNPYEYNISFISPMSLAVEEMVDTDVYILLEDEKNPIERREIYGKIFSAKEESMIADKFVYRLHVVHPLFYLGTTKRYEIYQEMTVVDIIQKVVLSYAGVLNVEFASHVPPGPIREYTTQYEQSDLAFIQMLCQEEGITLNLQGNQPNFSVVLDNINDSYLKLPLPLECHYNESKTFRVSHMQQDYYDFRSPSLEYSNSAGSSALSQTLPDNPKSAQLRNDLKHYKLRDRLEAARSSDSKRYTQQNSLHNYSNAEIIYGSSESLLTCDGYGGILDEIKTINQTEAIITKVAYDGFFPNALEEHNEEIDAQRPWQFSTTFEAIPMTTVFIPPVTVTKPRIYSTVTARVSGGQSAEALGSGENTIDIDTLGRIRVIFHFDPNYPTSCYIRFTNFSAGNGWGAQFIPRVNTEVVVSFLNGDPDRPIAIGSLYNGENKIPESLPANKTKSYIKTQSLPGGPDQFNLLSFEDKGGSELVHMKAQKDHLLHVLHDSDNYIDHDERTTVGNDRTEHVKHDEAITIDNNRTEKVGVDEFIQIGSNRSESVGNNESISIGANQKITIAANRSESVGRDERITVNANRDHTIGQSESLAIAKNSKLKVKKNYALTIGGNHSEKVSKLKTETTTLSSSLSVGMGYQITVGALKNETVGLISSEQVGQLKHIIVGNEFSVTVGESSFSMKRDGTIILKGGKALNLFGAENVVLKGATLLEFIDSAKKSSSCKMAAMINGNKQGSDCPLGNSNPVNAILGIKVLGDTKEKDFIIKAPFPIDWQRMYASDNPREGMLGQGWMVPLEYELEIQKKTIIFHYRHDTQLEFEPIAIGDESIITKRGFRLIRTQAKAYQLILNSGTIFTFKEYAEDHYKITAIGDRHGNRLNLMFNQHKQISYIATADARLFELQYVSIEIEEEVETSKPKSKANQEQNVKNKKPKRHVQRLQSVIEHIYTKEKFTLSDQAQGKKEEQLIECQDQRLFYLGFINGQLHTIAAYPSKAKHELEEKSKLSIQKAAQEILITYRYSQEGDLVEVKNQAGITKRLFEYTNHMMTAHKEPEGLESYYAYDQYEPTGKVTKSWSNRGEAWEFTYEDKKTTVTDHTGNEEYFIYDEDNYLLERGDAYSSIGFEYTPKGLLSKLTDEVGRVKELRYNIWGQPTVIKEFNTVLTRIYYDKATQQPIKVRDGLDNVVRFEHDERGNLTKVIYPNQSETTYEYNQQGKLMSVTNPLKGTSRYTYNSQGSLVSQTTPNGAVTTYHYDREGKITQKSNALGNSSYVIYDTQKRVQASIDAHQSRTEYFYDKTDRIIKTKDGINNEIHYQYNTQARLYRITDPVGNDTKYFYDNAGRFEQELSPSKELSVRSYNPDNTLNSITRRDNSEIVFTYNALRVPSEILYTATDSRTQKTQTLRELFGYDTAGRVTQASNAHSLVRLGYNRIGKINQEQQFFNAFTIQKTSDAKTHTDTLSFAGTTVQITHDFTTRTKTLTKNNRYPITIHYDTQGIETKIVYPNGLEERYTFNPTYQLIAIETAYQRLSYQYDKVGNIVQKSGHTYRYDAIGRVIQANQHSFVYDKAGNNQNDYARYDQTTYQLLENQRYRFTYDRRGNLQTKTDKPNQETTYYRFNLLNQLTEVITKDRDHRTIKTFRYEYDALNRRIMKQEDNQTYYYLYDGLNIIAILSETKQVLATIVHHDTKIDTPLSIHTIHGIFYYHRDHQGSIIALSDEYGDIVETIQYDDHYGTITKHWIREDIKTLNPFGYTGRETDHRDLYYYRARYYDPTVQRFLSLDPIGFAAGDFNFYRYVGNNSVNRVDPMGLYDPVAAAIQPNFGNGDISQSDIDNWNNSVMRTGAGSLNIPSKQQPKSQIDNVLKDKPWIAYGSTIPSGGKECADYSREQVNQGEGNYTAVGGGIRNQLSSKVEHFTGAPWYKFNNCKEAINLIDKNLEQGRAVMTGVDYKDGNAGNENSKTDHYVTIVGRGTDENGTYYSYYDNYTGSNPSILESVARDTSLNRFRVNEDDSCVLIDDDGTLPYNRNDSNDQSPKTYTVTEVRDNE